MPPMMEPMDRNPMVPTWYGVIIGAIFSNLQLIYQSGSDGGGVLPVESHFHLLKQTVSLFASLSLISLTSGNPLPSTNPFRISLLFAISVVAAPLSAVCSCSHQALVAAYLACIRPLYDLLLNLYLFCTDIPWDPFWDFCNSIVNAAYQFKLSALQIIQRFVPNFVGTSLEETNSNSQGGIRNTEA